MNEILSHRKAIEETLQKLHEMFLKEYSHLEWGEDVLERVFAFSTKGKLLRGGLVVQGAAMVGKSPDRDVYLTASAMELVHSALLIHDDIMDRDALRRGAPSLYHQYQVFAEAQDKKNPREVGQSMGICVGDITFFLVYRIISMLESEHKVYLSDLLSRELATVAFGQMQDIWPLSSTKIEDILSLYKYKTGRYSFSLPLLLGVGLSGRGKEFEEKLFEFGEVVGPLFQIIDDKIGIYGDEEEIGKSIGSDIKEGKLTLYWLMLLERVNNEEKEFLQTLMEKNLSEESITRVKNLLSSYNVNQDIEKIVEELYHRSKLCIVEMDIHDKDKETLSEVVEFVASRRK